MPKIVPDIVSKQALTCVLEMMTVREACQLMAAQKIAAVMICAPGGRLAGIMTERDVSVRVVACGLDPDHTPVGAVMTRDPDTLEEGDHPGHALRMMQENNYRHMPVVDGRGHAVGMVSVRDLYAWVQKELEYDLRACEAYIADAGYGAVN